MMIDAIESRTRELQAALNSAIANWRAAKDDDDVTPFERSRIFDHAVSCAKSAIAWGDIPADAVVQEMTVSEYLELAVRRFVNDARADAYHFFARAVEQAVTEVATHYVIDNT